MYLKGDKSMEGYNLYQDIAQRTQGDIYIGVVGPVRTGKSTFIKRFMDLMVLPNIENAYKKERARDEMPQSAAGRTIMTTEPKFVPTEAVGINLGDAECKVRLIDCVGYIVNSALGAIEDGQPRMVQTPWNEEPVPFNSAAEIGTQKVINEHSTIGLVVTTDGSVAEIPRADYVEAEQRVVSELKEINKPFMVVLNSINPAAAETQQLRTELEQQYGVPVLAMSCAQMNETDIQNFLETILYEFPLKEVGIKLPKWLDALEESHPLKKNIYDSIIQTLSGVTKIREAKLAAKQMEELEFASESRISAIDLGSGVLKIQIQTPEGLFYQVLSETTGFDIAGDDQLLSLLVDLKGMKKEYDKVSYALKEVEAKGYGIVSPTIDELTLEEPEIVKQGNRYGVKLRASAPSIHMIRADIETEVNPIVGSEKQSEELVKYLLEEFEIDPKKLWGSNIFGKSLHELVNEGLHNKLSRMPEESRFKLQETLQKIINEGSGGLICIIL